MGITRDLDVGKLRKIIGNLPDNTLVKLSSDTGLDHDGHSVIEDAYVANINDTKVLKIYANNTYDDEFEDYY